MGGESCRGLISNVPAGSGMTAGHVNDTRYPATTAAQLRGRKDEDASSPASLILALSHNQRAASACESAVIDGA